MTTLLYLITGLTDCAAFLLVFAVTRRLADLGVDALTLGWIGAVFSATSVFSNVLSGSLSDRFGRRRVAVAGTVLLAISVLAVAALPPQGWMYVAAYGLGGIAVGTIYPPLIAWLSHGRAGRAASRVFLGFCLAFNVGMVSGQYFGGLAYLNWGPESPLYAALALLAGSVSLLWITPPATGQFTISAEPKASADQRQLSTSFSRLAWVANFGGTFSASILWYLFPKLAVDMDISPDHHGQLLVVNRLVVIATFVSMHFSEFWRHRFLPALVAQVIGLAGLISLATAQSPAGLTLGLGALGVLLGYNYFASLFYSTTGSTDQRKGTASGIHEATLALGLAGGSLGGGLAGDLAGNRAPFLLGGVIVAGLAVVQCWLYPRLIRPLIHPSVEDQQRPVGLNARPVADSCTQVDSTGSVG